MAPTWDVPVLFLFGAPHAVIFTTYQMENSRLKQHPKAHRAT